MSPPGDLLVADIANSLLEARQRRGSALFYHSPVEAPYYAPVLLLSEPGAAARPASATSATSASAVFDAVDDQSAYSASTAPPRRGPEPVPLERAPVPDFSAAWLPCEFRRLSGCEARFALDQVEAWIEHVTADHLRGVLPWRSICWFCDGADFQAAAAASPEDQLVVYRSRMYHIAAHFADGMTAADVRWDFGFLDHVHDNGLISEAAFQWAKQQSESVPMPRGVVLISPPRAARARGDGRDERRRRHRQHEPSRRHHMRRIAE